MAKSSLTLKTPTATGDTSKLAVNMALLSFGGLLLYAGWTGGSLLEVLTGSPDRSQTGQGSRDNDGDGAGSAAGAAVAATPNDDVATAKGSPMAKQGTVPPGLGTFDGHPVAKWIIPSLVWARKHGWKGKVVSGYRNQQEELAAATRYGRQHYSTWPPKSNHTGKSYPRGAVDVTEYQQLAKILKRSPILPRLVWAGPVIGDQVHFSATGH